MSAPLLKAKKLEASLLQIIEQPHTGRRLCIAVFPAAHEIETAPEFVFTEQLDEYIKTDLREAVIKALQRQITTELTRHHSQQSELEQRAKEMQREQAKEQRKQLDLWQAQNIGKEALQIALGKPVRLDELGNPYPDIAPF